MVKGVHDGHLEGLLVAHFRQVLDFFLFDFFQCVLDFGFLVFGQKDLPECALA